VGWRNVAGPKKPECSWGDPNPSVVAHTMSSTTTLVQLAGDPAPRPDQALVVTWCTRCGTMGDHKVVKL